MRNCLSAFVAVALSVLAVLPLTAGHPASWRGQPITELTPEEVKALGWKVVVDGVMGGRSTGEIDFTDEETMRFSGRLSLENNGGFSMVETGAVDLDLSGDLGILLRVRGDGRTYNLRLESSARFRNWPVAFSSKFTTPEDGSWTQVKVPFSSFEGGFRGRKLPDAILDPSKIGTIGILLGDKKEGKFQIEVDWIRTYGKGQGAKANNN